jgi:hypothetical protein
LTLTNQCPAQLPQALQDEIFGNVAPLVALNLGATDAQLVRREFLDLSLDGRPAQPVSIEAIVSLKVGAASARLCGGACMLSVLTEAPIRHPPPVDDARVRAVWSRTFQAANQELTGRQTIKPHGELEDELLD